MLREYTAELKNYNFYQEFRKDYYVDAYDEHKWKVGRIKNIVKYGLRTTVQIHFDGHTVRFDQNYDLPSSHKLAPLRTYTLPYTGYLDFEPKRDESEITKPATLLKELQKLIKGEKSIDKNKASFINQFLRGELFIAADYYACKRSYESRKDLEQAIAFLISYLKEGSKLLHQSLQFLKDIEKQNSLDTNLFTVHPKVALLLANTEFLFVVNTLTGNKDNRAEIHKNFNRLANDGQDLIKVFRGVVAQCKILEACQKIMEFKTANGRGLPWSLKKQIAILYSFTKEGYVFPMPSDHRELIEILDYMSYFSNKGLLPKDDEEKKSLELIVNLILNGNFEGRLRGLNELKKIIDYSFRRKDNILQQFKSKDLLNFLIDNKNFNPELFKRSLPVFEFCSKNQLLTGKHLNQILELHKDKHELQIKSFYSSLAEFPAFLDPAVVKLFLNQITQRCPLNEFLITLVKDYTINAITKNQYYSKNYCKEGEELALNYYWSLINSEAAGLPYPLKIKVVEAFALVIRDLYYTKEVEKYMSLAIKGIANRKNLEFYFKVIHATLKLSKGTRIAKTIESIQKELSIVDCVIDGVKSGQGFTDSLWECMFQFLEEVTYASKRKFTYPQARQFWKIKQCRKYFMKLLRKYRFKKEQDKSQQKIINKQLHPDLIRQLLDKIFLDPKEMEDYKNINLDLYQTVDQLIIAYNHYYSFIDYNYKHTIRTKNVEKVVALEFYTNVINNAQEKEIIEKAIHRLVEMGARVQELNKVFENAKINNWTFILEKISKLKRNQLLGYQIMLEDLKGRMKSLNILDPDSIAVPVQNRATGEKKIIYTPRYTSLWKLRHLIGKEFGMEGLAFEMNTLSSHSYKDSNFEREEDFSVMLITFSKEQTSVLITPTKIQKHPHLESLDNFYKIMSDTKGEQLVQWLSREDGDEALSILQKLPLVRKFSEKILKLTYKDPNEVLDSNALHKLTYQLKIINSQKNIKHSIAMLDRGFVIHIAKILANKKVITTPAAYTALTPLVNYLNELLKFIKMSKTPQMFNENFLTELFQPSPSQFKECPQFVSFMVRCFQMARDLSNNKDLLALFKVKVGVIFQSPSLEKVLEIVLLSKNNQKIAEVIVDLARSCSSQSLLQQVVNRLLNLDLLIKKQHQCKHLFELIAFLLDKKVQPYLLETIKKFFRQIRKNNIIEQSEEEENQLLSGYAQLLLKIHKLANYENVQEIFGDKYANLVNYVVQECLLNVEEPHKNKFKSQTLRTLGYELLEQLEPKIAAQQLNLALNKALSGSTAWRKSEEWKVSPVKQVTHTFTGLKNLAATCYINSLLQQLFFIDSLSSQLLALDAEKIDDKQNIVYELQNIFSHLKFSESPIHTTSSLCKRFILDGQPIDPRIQTDVDEFFHSLIDKLERNLSKINRKEIITNLFGGQISNLIIGSKCEHTSERIEPFLSIRLEIKDKKNLEEAFNQFIKGEVLEGDNAYFCQRCDTKVKALKRVCLKTLPEILIITLKRFEFDYETMEKFKLNTYCQFPDMLNVLPYTRDGIDNDFEANEQDYCYKLKGVVIHYGVSEAGHYTSYIQTEQKQWYYFDDQKITDFDPKNIGEEAFGGIQENPFGDDEEKKKNAYLLFYEKVKKSSQVKTISLTQLKETPAYKSIFQENMKNKLLNLLFDINLEDHIVSMVKNNLIDPKLFLIFFHLVLLRSARKIKIDFFYNYAEILLKNYKEYAEWYLSQVNESFLHEFLFNTDPDIRLIIVGLIIQALKSNPNLQIGKVVLEQLAFFIGKRNMYPAAKIFSTAVKLNKSYEKHMKQIGLADIVVAVVKGKEAKGTKNLQGSLRKNQNQLGDPHCLYQERNILDSIDFLQAIEGLKCSLTEQDVDLTLLKRIKKNRTQQSLAIILARRAIQPEGLAKLSAFLIQGLIKSELSLKEEYIFGFYLHLVEQIAKIDDPLTSRRILQMTNIYLIAIKESLTGYKAESFLLLGLFRICSLNRLFRDRVSEELQEKDSKKLLKDVRSWIKEIGSRPYDMIKQDRCGYWRKPRQYGVPSQVPNSLLSAEEQPSMDKFLSALNSIVEKHNSFLRVEQDLFKPNERVRFGESEYKFLKDYGLTAEIVSRDDNLKIVALDELTKMDYF